MGEDPMSETNTQILDGFASSLLSPKAVSTPPGIINPFGGEAIRRYNVYRNNVAVGLEGALADIFPVVQNLVGETFFSTMALNFINCEPPNSPIIAEYGRAFPAFVARFTPASDLFFLKDVARLERAWLDAYHALDATPLATEALMECAPDALMALTLSPHPATAILKFETSAVSIFQLTKSGASLKNFDPTPSEIVLITRPQCDVQVFRLDIGSAVFLESLITGDTIGEAAEAAFAAQTELDLAAAFSLIITSGAFERAVATGT